MVEEALRTEVASSPALFETVFVEQFPIVRRTVARIVGFESAEDIAMEAFARAYARWDAVGSMDYPIKWIQRVAINLALDQTRRKRRWSPGRDTADSQEDSAQRESLLQSLRRLPRRQQQVVVLRYIVDLKEEDVARYLGVSLGTVKTHLRRALPRLRSDLIASEEVK